MIKFALAKEQRLHFEKHQLLELEGLFTPLQIHLLHEKINQTLALSASPQNWKRSAIVERNFNEGRDLFRKDLAIRKLVADKGLAKIASELLGGKFIRLAYDQLLPNTAFMKDPLEKLSANSKLSSLFLQPRTLEEISCIRGILGGVCVCLNSAPNTEENSPLENSIFPKRIGHVVFFSGDKPIDFSELANRPEQEFLLIAYAAKTAIYATNDVDAHQHTLKMLGYIFGDRLNDELNPVLCRD